MEIQSQGRKLLFSTVRIETTDIDGTAVGSGTSFIFHDPASANGHELFLVSNKHVIESGWNAHVFFTQQASDGTPLLGEPFTLHIKGFSAQWHGHPDKKVDIAVMPLSWHLNLIAKDDYHAFIRPITLDDLASEDDLAKLDIASPVLFIGYPNGMFDQKHYTPIVRQGFLATLPELDFNDEPVFLIDASVFPGSSGSPVFTYEHSWDRHVVSIKLMGIISAVFTQRTDGQIEWSPAPTNLVPIPTMNQMIDLGVVFKARLIREAISDFWRKKKENAA
jgi:S1-C subfamily serine protease